MSSEARKLSQAVSEFLAWKKQKQEKFSSPKKSVLKKSPAKKKSSAPEEIDP